MKKLLLTCLMASAPLSAMQQPRLTPEEAAKRVVAFQKNDATPEAKERMEKQVADFFKILSPADFAFQAQYWMNHAYDSKATKEAHAKRREGYFTQFLQSNNLEASPANITLCMMTIEGIDFAEGALSVSPVPESSAKDNNNT
jgi:hypothetical protein